MKRVTLKDILLITGNSKHPLSIRGIPVGHRTPKGIIRPKLARVNVGGRNLLASSSKVSERLKKFYRLLREV